jgi:hypothetical protein
MRNHLKSDMPAVRSRRAVLLNAFAGIKKHRGARRDDLRVREAVERSAQTSVFQEIRTVVDEKECPGILPGNTVRQIHVVMAAATEADGIDSDLSCAALAAGQARLEPRAFVGRTRHNGVDAERIAGRWRVERVLDHRVQGALLNQ